MSHRFPLAGDIAVVESQQHDLKAGLLLLFGESLIEFMLTDGQDILLARDFFPARANARPLPEGASLHFLDPAKGLDEDPKWSKQYRDIVTNPAH